jgi:hypothetical protein
VNAWFQSLLFKINLYRYSEASRDLRHRRAVLTSMVARWSSLHLAASFTGWRDGVRRVKVQRARVRSLIWRMKFAAAGAAFQGWWGGGGSRLLLSSIKPFHQSVPSNRCIKSFHQTVPSNRSNRSIKPFHQTVPSNRSIKPFHQTVPSNRSITPHV